MAHAPAAFLEGRWAESFNLFDRSASFLRERRTGPAVTFFLDSANFYQLASLVHLGGLKELARRVPRLIDEAAGRGDRYALTHLRTGVLTLAWLSRGDNEGARREAEDAIRRWSRQGTHLPHFMDVLAQAQIDLYEGHRERAYKRVEDTWGKLKGAMLLRVQFIRIKMLELRARGALAMATLARGDAEPYRRDAERWARDIEAERTRWGSPLAKLVRAAVAVQRGDKAKAIALLDLATNELDVEKMELHVAAARWAHGELIGGTRGAELLKQAKDWLASEDVKDPARFMDMLVPGGIRP
jgi:hypothetical protein